MIKSILMTIMLAIASQGAVITYTDASEWNQATSHHAMTQLNNGNTGPFTLSGSGYTFGTHNVTIGFLSNSDSLTITLSNGDRIQGLLLGGSNTPIGSQICAEADGLQVGCWPNTVNWTGAWGFTLDAPATAVKLYSTGNVTWSMDYLKASTSPASSEIPEPSSMGMIGLGLIGIAAIRKKRG
jgi:hypothetical protein